MSYFQADKLYEIFRFSIEKLQLIIRNYISFAQNYIIHYLVHLFNASLEFAAKSAKCGLEIVAALSTVVLLQRVQSKTQIRAYKRACKL